MLSSKAPDTVLRQLETISPELLQADPAAILVLMRRLFTWGQIPKMLELRGLLLEAVSEDGGLPEEERGSLLGECDLIMSFLCYNDIEKMSLLHQSACSRMTRPAASIRTYGTYTFGSPSVLMMFHRTAGAMAQEVQAMNRAMPYYYQVTQEHGAGAELIMEAEAAFYRGDFHFAKLLNTRAEYRTAEKHQVFLQLCCSFLSMRMQLFDPQQAAPAPDEQALRRLHNATLLLTFDGIRAYCAALLDAPERIPPAFSRHQLAQLQILNPAKPMLAMIENQVYLAQGCFEQAAVRSEALLQPCLRLHYALVALHAHLQAAAAYGQLGRREQAAAALQQALDLAVPDNCVVPFAENYRLLAPLLHAPDCTAPPEFLQRIHALGEAFLSRRAALRQPPARPAVAAALSERELEIAQLAAGRATNREIAAKLFLSEGTVKQYISQIYSKLQLDGDARTKRSRLAALLKAAD